MMILNREELAWAAGLFDGEGNACRSLYSRQGGAYYPRMQVAQSGVENPAVLIRFHNAVGGLGHISGPFRVASNNLVKPPTNGSLPQWKWCVYRFEHLQVVAAMLWPFLSQPKRNQIKRTLTPEVK